MNSRRHSGFLKSYLSGLLRNVSWTEPAWILLILHITFGVPLWTVFAGLTVWFVVAFFKTEFANIRQNHPELLNNHRTHDAAFPIDGSAPVSQREYAAYCDLLSDRDI